MWNFIRKSQKVKPEELSEYLDGRLTGKAREGVERILASSPEAREELESLRATVNLVRQLPTTPPRRSFVMAAPPVRESVEPVREKPRPSLPLRAPQWVYAAAASVAALAFSVLLSADLTGALSRDGEAPSTPESQALRQFQSENATQDEDKRASSGATSITADNNRANHPEDNRLQALPPQAAETAPAKPGESSPASPDALPPDISITSKSTKPELAPAPQATGTPPPLGTPAPQTGTALNGDNLARRAEPAAGGTPEPGETMPSATVTPVPGEEGGREVYGFTATSPATDQSPPEATQEASRAESTPVGWRVLQGVLAVIGLGSITGLVIRWRQSRQA